MSKKIKTIPIRADVPKVRREAKARKSTTAVVEKVTKAFVEKGAKRITGP